MNYMVNYESMSDFEINKRVAEDWGLLVQEIDDNSSLGMTSDFHKRYPNVVWVAELDCSTGQQCEPWWQFDPCNDWGHGGPIIVESKISLIEDGCEWSAYLGFESLENMEGGGCYFTKSWSDKNPLRAAMIVYLMMQEDKLNN